MIDAYASAPWYLDHLRPIMAALGSDAGKVYEGYRLHIHPRDLSATVLVASYGDLSVARAAGYKRFALAQHGAGQSYAQGRTPDYPSYPGGRNHGDVGLFLVPNEHAARRWRQAYPRARVVTVGCPKLETLPRREPGPGPVIAVSWHWDFNLCPETHSAFREFAAAVAELAKRYTVIGHGHPKRQDLRQFYRRVGIEHVPSFAEVCRRADLYAVDNSSTLFEFSATGRPVVVMNSRDYRRDVTHGLRFWEASGVGPNANRGPELLPAVERALECRPDDVSAREAALDLVYQPRSGGSALAAEVLRQFASEPAKRPIDGRARRRLA